MIQERTKATDLESWHFERDWISVTRIIFRGRCDVDHVVDVLRALIAEQERVSTIPIVGQGGDLWWMRRDPWHVADIFQSYSASATGDRQYGAAERVRLIAEGPPLAVDHKRMNGYDIVEIATHHAVFDGMAVVGLLARIIGANHANTNISSDHQYDSRVVDVTEVDRALVGTESRRQEIPHSHVTVSLEMVEGIRKILGQSRSTLNTVLILATHLVVAELESGATRNETRVGATKSQLSSGSRKLIASGSRSKTGNDTSMWVSCMTDVDRCLRRTQLADAINSSLVYVDDATQLMDQDAYVSYLGMIAGESQYGEVERIESFSETSALDKVNLLFGIAAIRTGNRVHLSFRSHDIDVALPSDLLVHFESVCEQLSVP